MISDDKANILIVDDKQSNLLSIRAVVEQPGREIFLARSGNDALVLLLEHDFALILMDVQMPEMDGFETTRLIRSSSKTCQVPIIFITAANKDERHIFRAYDTGAVDYLMKPLNPIILKSKVNVFIELYMQKRSLEIIGKNLEQALMESESSKKIIERQNLYLNEIAIRDGLTGLYNHRHMDSILETELKRAQRYKTDLSCLLMDIDFFKEINDSMGHPFGDVVLVEFSKEILAYMRESDYCFRYGGEEFMVLLPQTSLDGARHTADQFRKTIEKKVFKDDVNTTGITISTGVASLLFNKPDRAADLIAYADKALFSAKSHGRNRVEIFINTHEEGPVMHDDNRKTLAYLKKNLASILEKTRKASLTSLELLVRDTDETRPLRHNRQVSEYIVILAHHTQLGSRLTETLKRVSTIHDCFQILIGDDRMDTKDQLDMDDLVKIKDHPYLLTELTELFDFFSDEKRVLITHHENYDGSGYPEGLAGDQIPLGARIFAIADAFVSMTTGRGTREKKSTRQALDELANNAGTQFDPELVPIFIDAIKAIYL